MQGLPNVPASGEPGRVASSLESSAATSLSKHEKLRFQGYLRPGVIKEPACLLVHVKRSVKRSRTRSLDNIERGIRGWSCLNCLTRVKVALSTRDLVEFRWNTKLNGGRCTTNVHSSIRIRWTAVTIYFKTTKFGEGRDALRNKELCICQNIKSKTGRLQISVQFHVFRIIRRKK